MAVFVIIGDLFLPTFLYICVRQNMIHIQFETYQFCFALDFEANKLTAIARGPHRRSGLANLPSMGANPLVSRHPHFLGIDLATSGVEIL